MNKSLIIFLLLQVITLASQASAEQVFDDWLYSARFEVIEYSNFGGQIRETDPAENRLYFNNIYLNAEGSISQNIDFILEYQAKTSDLYLLGGFVTLADSLEGIGSDEGEVLNARQVQVAALAKKHLDNITQSEHDLKFERAHIDYTFNDSLGLKLGSVRIPFGFWDDYSLLRNLSAGKTDPITIGVQLRRADMGALVYGKLADSNIYIEAALVYGEEVFEVFEVSDNDNDKDLVLKMGTRISKLDVGVNTYLRDIGHAGDVYALGVYYRYRINSRFTLLGENVFMHNKLERLNTRFSYLQGNYDLGDKWAGVRWNFFIESYNSDLLKADLEDDVTYTFSGTHIQISSGLMFAYNRNVDMGFQYITGADEEGDLTSRFTAKLDIQF